MIYLEEMRAEFGARKIDRLLAHVMECTGYAFNDARLLVQAFLRENYINEHRGCSLSSYQVLEYVGDKYLDAVLAKKIYCITNKFTNGDIALIKAEYGSVEGYCTAVNNILAEGITEAVISAINHLDEYLFLGNDKTIGDKEKEDVLEALIGAIAIDSGYNINKIDSAIEHLYSLDDCQKTCLVSVINKDDLATHIMSYFQQKCS